MAMLGISERQCIVLSRMQLHLLVFAVTFARSFVWQSRLHTQEATRQGEACSLSCYGCSLSMSYSSACSPTLETMRFVLLVCSIRSKSTSQKQVASVVHSTIAWTNCLAAPRCVSRPHVLQKKTVVDVLSKPMVWVVKDKRSSIGSEYGPSHGLKQSCLARMRCWLKLCASTIQAEFPDFALVQVLAKTS